MSKLCIFQRWYLEQILYREANGGQEMPQARFPIGTQFEKEFPGYGTFKGRVKFFDGSHYRVVYPEDGDAEDITEAELSKLKILSPVPAAAKQRKPKTPATAKQTNNNNNSKPPENVPSTTTNNNNNVNSSNGGDATPPTEALSAANNNRQPKYPVGTVFAKVFPGHGCYVGRVTAFDGTFYKVYYSYDKDEEDFEEADFNNVTILKKQDGAPVVSDESSS